MDAEQRYIPRTGMMFSRGSLARAELATDLVIPLVAEGGWSALTLRNVAQAANVTPQAIAAWFPSVQAMRVAVAARYGDRWIRHVDYRARTRTRQARHDGELRGPSELAAALLPQSWLEEVFDGVWLSIMEAGRWDEAIGRTVVTVQEQEHELVCEVVEATGQDAELVLSLVRGLRATHG
jgi:AcrR family transcriptional regulator